MFAGTEGVVRRLALCGGLLSAGTAVAWDAHDGTAEWDAARGRAAEAANWRDGVAPGGNTQVRVSNGGEMTVDGTAAWGALWVGYGGTGAVVQTAGTLTLANPGNASGDGTLWLGFAPGDAGTYRLDGGMLAVAAGNPQIGRQGRGLLDIAGGTFTAPSSYVSIGRLAGGTGFADVRGGGVLEVASAPQVTVGENGTGVAAVRGGGRLNAGKTVLAAAAGATGMVHVAAGGTLAAKSVAVGAGAGRINAVGGTVTPGADTEVEAAYLDGVPVSVGAGGLTFDTGARTVALKASLAPSRLTDGNLAHRWRFDGDLTDAVGTMDAKAVGTVFDGGALVLPGTAANNRGSYVALGAGCLPSGRDGVTVEMWVTHAERRAWSRLFTCAAADARSQMFLAWSRSDRPADEYLTLKTAGTVNSNGGNYLAPWGTGEAYHLSLVFAKTADGWRINVCKRDAATGAVLKRYVTTAAADWDPADLATGYFNLGYSDTSGDPAACARYDEVRIWTIALTEDELLESATRGPDADFASDAGLRKTGDGLLAVVTDAAYAGATTVAAGTLALAAPLTPSARWRGPIDLPGGAHGTAYRALGSGLVPTGAAGFTLEFWATLLEARTWSRLFTLTSAEGGNVFMSWVGGGGTDNTRDYISAGGSTVGNRMAPYTIGQTYHIAVTFFQTDGAWTARFCKQNADSGELESTFEIKMPDGWTTARFADATLNLGWSTDAGNDDAHARYEDVRLWPRAFTVAEVTASGRLGPGALPVFIPSDAATGALPAGTALTVADGAAFRLGGAAQTVAALSGAGTVAGPGVLTVTGGIRPGGAASVGTLAVADDLTLAGTVELDLGADGACDALAFASGGTFDISGLRWTVATAAPTVRTCVIATAAGTTLVGEPDVSALSAGYVLERKDGNLVLRRDAGTVLILR